MVGRRRIGGLLLRGGFGGQHLTEVLDEGLLLGDELRLLGDKVLVGGLRFCGAERGVG